MTQSKRKRSNRAITYAGSAFAIVVTCGVLRVAWSADPAPPPVPSGPSIFDDDWKPPKETEKKAAPAPPAESIAPPRITPKKPSPEVSKPPKVAPAPATPSPLTPAPVTPTTPAAGPITLPPERAPIPGTSALQPVEKTVREVFNAEYTKQTAADRFALARTLLREASQDASDPATSYVLLREARDIAAAGGDVETAVDASRGLRDRFVIDDKAARDAERAVLAAVATGMQSAPANVVTGATARRCADLAMQQAERDLALGDFPAAAQSAAIAEAAARKAADLVYWSRLQARVSWLRAVAAEFEAVRPPLATLKTNPNDPAANLSAGRFYALVVEQFDRGLPLLAKSADAALKTAATRDLSAAAGTAADQLAAADAWNEATKTLATLASTAPAPAPAAPTASPTPPATPAGGAAGVMLTKDAAQRRAIYWYGKALSHAQPLDGLARTTAMKKLNDLRLLRTRRGGLVGEYHTGTDFNRRAFTRVDPKIEFNWKSHSPDPTVNSENFSVRWNGWIKTTPGFMRLVAVHDDAVRIFLDGKPVIDKWHNKAGRDGEVVQFTGGLQEFRIEFAQYRGDAAMGLGWRPANVKNPDKTKPVPSEVLFYEAPAPAPVAAPLPAQTVESGAIVLAPAAAELHGDGPIIFDHAGGNKPDRIGYWQAASLWVSWDFEAPEGAYTVDANYACKKDNAGSRYVLSVGPSPTNRLTALVASTGDWDNFRTERLGVIRVGPGGQTLRIKPVSLTSNSLMDLAGVTLTPVK